MTDQTNLNQSQTTYKLSLPPQYCNNDFEGLFDDNAIKSSNTRHVSTASPSPTTTIITQASKVMANNPIFAMAGSIDQHHQSNNDTISSSHSCGNQQQRQPHYLLMNYANAMNSNGTLKDMNKERSEQHQKPSQQHDYITTSLISQYLLDNAAADKTNNALATISFSDTSSTKKLSSTSLSSKGGEVYQTEKQYTQIDNATNKTTENNSKKRSSLIEYDNNHDSCNDNVQTKKVKVFNAHRYVKVVPSDIPGQKLQKNAINNQTKDATITTTITSPLTTYTNILKSNSYNLQTFTSLSKYYSKPSQLQIASFGKEVLSSVYTRNKSKMKHLLCHGLSPNPCNKFGDSILNTICKRGDEDLFFTLINECGTSIHTSDHFGRTPLHYVCWSHNVKFDVVTKILELDLHMLQAKDKVGKTPLEYVSFDKWDCWNMYLTENQERFWPLDKIMDDYNNNEENQMTDNGYIRSEYLADPCNALSIHEAELVSSGDRNIR